jgi:hypothetical protein
VPRVRFRIRMIMLVIACLALWLAYLKALLGELARASYAPIAVFCSTVILATPPLFLLTLFVLELRRRRTHPREIADEKPSSVPEPRLRPKRGGRESVG